MPLALLALVTLLAGDWARPVAGDVTRAFDYDRAAPFAAGRHRGVDLGARAGQIVRAPCGGVVTFAGRVPSRGAGISIRCGALVATLVELGRVHARRGVRVDRGDVVGRARGDVHLGARRHRDGFGYLDPLTLISSHRPPLGPPPPATRRRPRPAARPGAAPRPVVRAARVPAGAWVGLGLIVAGVPLGAVVRRRRGVARRVVVPR